MIRVICSITISQILAISTFFVFLFATNYSTSVDAAESAVPFLKGNVFVGVGNGKIKQFSSSGDILATLDTTSGSSEETGMCFDSVGTLYTTNFSSMSMSKFNNQGELVSASWGGAFDVSPESCVIDKEGSIYVGVVNGPPILRKYDPDGKLLLTYTLATEDRGIDWIDLADNQCEMFYTSEGSSIKRFDVCTNTQLSDFTTSLARPCFALRIRNDGGVMVACRDQAYLLESTGEISRTYPSSSMGASFLFALNLDPDGKSFWTADYSGGKVYRIDIESGSVITSFDGGKEGPSIAGLAVVGELANTLNDSDGDGLFDTWESLGIDSNGDGTIDVDLPAMGADPNKKDIFVEIDWMEESGTNAHSHKPSSVAIKKIVDAFANSAVDNGKGINLHVDVGVDSVDYVTGKVWGDLSKGTSIPHQLIGEKSSPIKNKLGEDWNNISKSNFGHDNRVFHYTIFAHQIMASDLQSSCHSGMGIPQYIIVSLGCFTKGIGSENEQAGTFMHELGHSLGLGHGGGDNVNHKPNYLSVMNYSFQMSGLIIERDGKRGDGNFDYSRFDLPDLNETSLSELNGLNGNSQIDKYGTKYHIGFPYWCFPNGLDWFNIAEHANGPIDWNCNNIVGTLTDSNTVQADVNNEGGNDNLLTSYDDWVNLKYRANGIGQAGAPLEIEITQEDIQSAPIEITFEEDNKIRRVSEPRLNLSNVVSPATIFTGDTITFTILITSADSGEADGVVITDTLPSGFDYQFGSTSGATTLDPMIIGQSLVWGSFTISSNVGLTLTFKSISASSAGIYTNSVSASSTTGIVVAPTEARILVTMSTPTLTPTPTATFTNTPIPTDTSTPTATPILMPTSTSTPTTLSIFMPLIQKVGQ